VRSFFKTAARLKRLPFLMSLMSWLPESNGAQGCGNLRSYSVLSTHH